MPASTPAPEAPRLSGVAFKEAWDCSYPPAVESTDVLRINYDIHAVGRDGRPAQSHFLLGRKNAHDGISLVFGVEQQLYQQGAGTAVVHRDDAATQVRHHQLASKQGHGMRASTGWMGLFKFCARADGVPEVLQKAPVFNQRFHVYVQWGGKVERRVGVSRGSRWA